MAKTREIVPGAWHKPVRKSDEKRLLKEAEAINAKLKTRQYFLAAIDDPNVLRLPKSHRIQYLLGGMRLGFTYPTIRKKLRLTVGDVREWADDDPEHLMLLEEAAADGNIVLELTVMEAAKDDAKLAMKVLEKKDKETWGTERSRSEGFEKGVKAGLSLSELLNQRKNGETNTE